MLELRRVERNLSPGAHTPGGRDDDAGLFNKDSTTNDPVEPMAIKRTRRWSARVTAESNALDLERNVFTYDDPTRIARSLKRSAERSHRRKSDPYRSAMSMLTFYINRAGDNLGERQRRVLERAKVELRKAFGRDEPSPAKRRARRNSHRT
jgi:hypothetical protein